MPRFLPSSSCLNLSLLFLVALLPSSVQSNFLREGFSSKMESDFKSEMQLEDSNDSMLTSGMSREMVLMKDIEWQLQPTMDLSGITDTKLKKHVESFFTNNGPIKVKLSTRKGKYGFRAMGQIEKSGRKLRAFWRQSVNAGASGASTVGGSGKSTKSTVGADVLHASYDDAVRYRLSALEIELQLPPVSKKKKTKKSQLPSVIFTVAVEPGTMNPRAILPRGPAGVKILPEGRDSGKPDIWLGSAGLSYMTVPMKAGIVDYSWARGRAVFRKGRSI